LSQHIFVREHEAVFVTTVLRPLDGVQWMMITRVTGRSSFLPFTLHFLQHRMACTNWPKAFAASDGNRMVIMRDFRLPPRRRRDLR